MKKIQELKTLGDYRKAARDSLLNENTSPYDAVKTALILSRWLIDVSRANISEGDSWSLTLFPGRKYKGKNLQLFHCIELMEFAITYKSQSFGELFPKWPQYPGANIRVFTSAGLSYLEAAFDFVRDLGCRIISPLQGSYKKYRKERNIYHLNSFNFLRKNPAVDNLEINPVTDEVVIMWFNKIVKVIQGRIPESEFSKLKVETEIKSTLKHIEDEKTPKPKLMVSKLIVKHFEVSIATLRRWVKDEKLTDYREKPHAKNAPLILDAVEVARYFNRKP